MKLKLEDMIAKGIRHIVVDKRTLLYLEDVKKEYPNSKIHPADIYTIPVDGKDILAVMAQDIETMTEFDRKIAQSLNWKPKDN